MTYYFHVCPQCHSQFCNVAACRFTGLPNKRPELGEAMTKLKKEMEEILKGETKCFPKI